MSKGDIMKSLEDLDNSPYLQAYFAVCQTVLEYIRLQTGINHVWSDGATLIDNKDGTYTFKMEVIDKSG